MKPFPPIAGNPVQRHGFTRTDLLIILGVLVILTIIALMFPLVARYKATACKNQCADNLRQIGTALNVYFQDGHDRFPREWLNFPGKRLSRPDPGSPTGHYCSQGFDAALEPYLKQRALFICPSDTALKSNIVVGWSNPVRNKWDDTSYGLNLRLSGKPREACPDPASTILLAHTRFEHTIWNDQASALFETHDNGNNYVFSDGHVQFLDRKATYNPKNHWKP